MEHWTTDEVKYRGIPDEYSIDVWTNVLAGLSGYGWYPKICVDTCADTKVRFVNGTNAVDIRHKGLMNTIIVENVITDHGRHAEAFAEALRDVSRQLVSEANIARSKYTDPPNEPPNEFKITHTDAKNQPTVDLGPAFAFGSNHSRNAFFTVCRIVTMISSDKAIIEYLVKLRDYYGTTQDEIL